MALSVLTNIAAMQAEVNLNNSQNSLNTALQRLSSGLKINTAADDPAGFVKSQEQQSQITGLNAAINNTTQATSLVQTSEGALTEINSLLQEMRGLALDSANAGANDSGSLAANQAEINNALDTINRIANNTQFGTKKILNGTAAATVTIGTTGSQNLTSAIAGANTVAGTYNVAIVQQGQKAQLVGTNAFVAATNVSTTTNGSVAAISGSATISSTNTQTGVYNVVVTQQGVKGGVTAAAAGDNTGAGATGNIVFTGGLLGAATATASITTANTVVQDATAIQTALNAVAGAGAYTVNGTSGTIVISSNVFGAETAGSLSVTSATGGALANTGFAVGNNTNQIANQAVQVQISGGNLASPITQTGSGAAGATISVSSGVANGLTFTVATAGNQSAAVGANATVNVTGGSSLTLGTGPNATTINLNAQNANNLTNLVTTIQQLAGTTGVNASASTGGTNLVLTASGFGGTNFAFSASGTASGVVTGQGYTQNAQALQAKVYDGNGNLLGGTITGAGPGGNVITAANSTSENFGAANGLSFTFAPATSTLNGVTGTQSPAAAATGAYTSSVTIADALVFQIGANANQTADISIQNVSAANLGLNVAGLNNPNTDNLARIDVTTANGAQDAIQVIDQAVSDISNIQGNLGAFQTNTLQSTQANLNTTLENTTAAESNITDTNFATETAALTKNQILVQAGTSVLATANQDAQLVLNLLK